MKYLAVRPSPLRYLFFVSVFVIGVAGCPAISPTDANPPTPTCDQVCNITNGATASSATTYWQIFELRCGQSACYTKMAFFADGTGKMIATRNNCLSYQVLNSPTVVNFTWTRLSSNAMLLNGATFACAPNNLAVGSTISSFTSITGGISSGTFSGLLDGVHGMNPASLFVGTF